LKPRVWEVAKEFNIPNKDALEMLKKHGVKVNNNFSVVEDVDGARQILARESGRPGPAAAAPAAAAAAPPAAARPSKSQAPPAAAKAGEATASKSATHHPRPMPQIPKAPVIVLGAKPAPAAMPYRPAPAARAPATPAAAPPAAPAGSPPAPPYATPADPAPAHPAAPAPRPAPAQPAAGAPAAPAHAPPKPAPGAPAKPSFTPRPAPPPVVVPRTGPTVISRPTSPPPLRPAPGRPGGTGIMSPPRGPIRGPIRQGPGGGRGPHRPMHMHHGRRGPGPVRSGGPAQPTQVPADRPKKKIEVTVPITVKEFSSQSGIKVPDLIRKLMSLGVMATINNSLKEEEVGLLGIEFGQEIVVKKAVDAGDSLLAELDKEYPGEKVPRAPVVTFMGHVDHGKTSLLDAIRNADVAGQEAGGITQHLGAYRVKTRQGRDVVFLDTPGHEAFTKMRARGANITDVAVLVVAADDGVMPQTEEAISHAKAAGVPIVVAVNKIDKPQANPERVKRQLADLGLIWDQWGGTTVFCDVSAVSKKGLDGLLEMLSLESDLLDLKTNLARPAMGAVLEGRMTEDRGAVARILVQNGTLRRGEVILAGRVFGKVRALVDEHGHNLAEAGPSTPVEVVGLPEAPEAGDRFHAVSDLNKAKSIAEERARRARETALRERAHITLENLFTRIAEGKAKEVRVILKADVKGSAEVLIKALQDLSTGEIKVRVLHQGIGGVTESDVLLADASDAMIIAFNVVPDDRARELARDKGVDVRVYQVIYHLMEELKAAMEGMLEPEEKEVVTAHLEIRQVFNISRVGTIAGCFVKSGTISRPDSIRLVRNGAIVYTGRMESLKRFKEDVKEVKEGFECGVKIAGYDDLKNGDVIESFRIEKIARKLG